ncbi:D-alpha,beta-D-heptose 7-phosphate 1-kinase [Microterricola gilva]|uniref:D-alpha,beta-D-heptose 7-phosphate 1-kinase n=1 Tax=Microterricola gilva TaxID=393267 RepID=A0A4Q8AN71_9MICO|nr:carbohydrate kinase family protein [Microterricola gilva]RZU65389.1 D-alpha,beta-D-heptose 7-phosphate 1-kinase [Microterricola gilva]
MTAPSAPAVFIGDVALDEYFAADTWVMPGNKALISTLATYVGGSIANAARVHARLGGETEFVSLLNSGELTGRMLAALVDGHVAVPHMLFDEEIGDPRNLIFLVEGEHVVFTPDVDERPMRLSETALAELARPGYLYTTLNRAARLRSVGLEAAGVLARLRDAGRRIVFDLDVDGFDGDIGLIEGAHVVMMNDRGFEKSFGSEASDADVRSWLESRGVDVLLRSQAADGAMAYTVDETIVAAGYSVPVADVTGAGDTLGGSLVFALGSGWPLPRAIAFAVAAASRSVMHLGPNGGVASIADVERFAADFATEPIEEAV